MFESMGRTLRRYAEKDGRGYPDWAMRYAPVARGLRRNGLNGGLVLEVGANENGLARFLDACIVAIDIDTDHLRSARAATGVRVVAADAAALPFRCGAFSASVCMDTLEHVPEAYRAAACRELVRVVRDDGNAVIAFPSGRAAQAAESAIRDAHRRFTGREIRWLEEHVDEGLPDADALAAYISQEVEPARTVKRTRNANLRVWRAVWRVLACGWPGRGNAVFQVLLRWATPVISRIHFGTCYRSMIWVGPKT